MKNVLLQKKKQSELIQTLSEAHHFELTKQISEAVDTLRFVWEDWNTKPKIEKYDPIIQAEILLRCGSILSWHTYTNQRNDLGTTARDWLTESARMFENLKIREKIAEAQVETAMSYWREGAYSESLIWVNSAENYLTTTVNWLAIKIYSAQILTHISLENFQIAQTIIEKTDFTVDLCPTDVVKPTYFINSALLYQLIEQKYEALDRYQKALNYAVITNNLPNLIIAENNIGNLHLSLGQIEKAVEYSNFAIVHCIENNDLGKLAHCYDSRANLCIKTEEYEDGLLYIEKAVKIVEKGTEYATFAEILWTKIVILIRLEYREKAIATFIKLSEIAGVWLSKAIYDEYSRKFYSFFYLKKNLTFDDEMLRFEREMIEQSLIENKEIGKTAAALGIKKHQTLSAKINKRHPELKTRIGLAPRKTRSDKAAPKPPVPSPIGVLKIDFDGKNLFIPADLKKPVLMEISSERLTEHGITPGAIAVAKPTSQKCNNRLVIIKDVIKKEIHAGLADIYAGLFGIISEVDDPIFIKIENVEILGEIIGYCRQNPATGDYDFFLI